MNKKSLFLVVLVVVTAFATPLRFGAAQGAASLKPVIIDTDMAMDDWTAILYLLARSDIEVKAITVTGTGEAHCNPGVQNALNLLLLAGKPTIPVTCGRETPLQGNRVFPAEWRSGVDAMAGITLEHNSNPPANAAAAPLLTDIIKNSPEKVTLLTLGPLTNIAEMLQADSSVIGNLAMIYIMGGAVTVPGNVMETGGELAEWNLYVDPLAAKIVIQSGAPITLIPLDATNQVPLTIAFYRRVAADTSTPSATFLYQVLTQNQDFVRSGTYFFWDTLAAAITADENLAQIEDRSLDVIDSGQTVVSDQGRPIRVAVNANGSRFETMFLNVLNGRSPDQTAAATPTPAAGDAQEEANKQIVRRYYEQVWGANDGSVLDEIAAPGFISYFLSDDTGSGTTTEMLKETIRFFHKAIPDLSVTIEDIFADGNKVAARITLRGKHTGQFFNIAPSGNPVALYLQTQITLAQGKMTEEWISLDLLFLFMQMGGISEEQVGKMLGWN